jgi:hypothetical protein
MVQGSPVIHARGPGASSIPFAERVMSSGQYASGLGNYYDLVEFNQDRGYASAVERRSSDRCR